MRFQTLLTAGLLLVGCRSSQTVVANEPTEATKEDVIEEIENETSACDLPHESAPDAGVQFVFVGADGNLYVQELTSEPSVIVNTGDVTDVSVSDLGNDLAFVRNTDDTAPALWLTDADGRQPVLLLDEAAIGERDPNFLGLPTDYDVWMRWIPQHSELLVELTGYPTEDRISFEAFRSDTLHIQVESTFIDSFAGAIDANFSPDGDWYAGSDEGALTLVRTDGSERLEQIFDNYRPIGLGSTVLYPPMVWLEDGVRVVSPVYEAPDGNSTQPPFEIWDVPFEGEPVLLDTIEDQASSILGLQLSPDGRYYAAGLPDWGLHEVGGSSLAYGIEQLGLSWWNSQSTRLANSYQRHVFVTDICGERIQLNAEPLPNGNVDVTWLGSDQLVVTVLNFDADLTYNVYYWSVDAGLSEVGAGWLSADASVVVAP